jgi:hypothetical protein
MQISAPIRVLGLVAILAAAALGSWTFLLGRNATNSPNAETVAPVAAAKSTAAKLDAHNEATAAKAAAKRAITTRATATPRTARPVTHPTPEIADGTPKAIASALRSHRVVVVLLHDAHSKIDEYSVDEARLGAQEAKAAFLRVNVLRERQAETFAKTYDVVQSPAVLLFVRPGKVAQKLVGFADHETVAQAVVNASHGVVVPLG